jgi:hypothetical protein
LTHSLAVLVLALLTTALVARAQAPAMVGSLGNFDVLNNTGEETHGFEIQLEGVSKADIYRIFGNWGGANVIRYGTGTATDYPGGVYIRWMSPYDPITQTFTLATPVPINRISPYLIRSVIAGEDANFCSHHGFDVNAIQDAMESNAEGRGGTARDRPMEAVGAVRNRAKAKRRKAGDQGEVPYSIEARNPLVDRT